jgi:hypothetical protein
MIGEQLRLLRVTNLQYHLANPSTRALIEKVGREALPKCRQFGRWPIIDVRSNTAVFTWRGRGEIVIPLRGTRLSYTPDPIRKSQTIGMVLDLTSGVSGSVEKFVKGCLWHMLEVFP